MKVYVELKRGFPVNADIQKAIDGFESLVYDIVPFQHSDIIMGKYDFAALKNVFVGSIDTMTALFKIIGKYPEPIDYPRFVLHGDILTRTVIKVTLKDLINCYYDSEIFIKPVKTKLFDGMLVTKKEDLNYFKGYEEELVWASDKIDIVSEWRAYVHNNKLVQCSNYAGDFTLAPDYTYIQKLIEDYEQPPVSYTIDVAVLKDGRTTVVEFNDFWAIGSYGLDSTKYTEMLRDRYFQIVGG